MSFPHSPPSSIASLLPQALKGRTPKKIDSIYLDTTYLSPSYCFPAQELVIQACADLVKERVVEGREEALWRADGRDNERKGIKGWLNNKEEENRKRGGGGQVVVVKGQVKEDQDGDGDEEEMGLEMLDALPEEEEGDGLGGEESMAVGRREGEENEDDEGYDGEEDDGEEWRMIREMESQQAETPRDDGTVEEHSQGLEELPTTVEEQVREDIEFTLDNNVKPEEKMEEDSKVELKPKLERDHETAEELKPDLALGIKPDLEDVKPHLKDEKPDVKPKTERLLVMIGTYSIGKER